MKLNFTNKLFIVAFVLISLLGVSTIYIFGKLNDANDMVVHTYQVQKQLQLVEREFLVTVAAQRSFLLTSDSVYTSYYDNASERMYASVDSLKSLVKDNKYQMLNCDTLKVSLNRRDSAFSAEISYFNDSSNSKEQRNAKILSNLPHSQEIVRVYRNMQYEEEKYITMRKENVLDNRAAIPFMIVLTTLGAIAILIQAVYFLNKRLRTKRLSLEKTNALVKQLNQSNIELERFAFVASHDLQEPLRKIQIFSERFRTTFLKKNGGDDPDFLKYLDRIENSASTMSSLVSDLLEYSKLQGKLLRKENLDIAHLFGNKITEVLADGNVAYKYYNKSKQSPLLSVMPSQIDQLLQNLVDNAVKYRDSSKALLILELEYEKIEGEESFHKFSFSDNGIGFEPQYKEKIFDVFSRLVNKQDIKGTGMGLSICKQIMLNHDGKIEASSILKEGTTISIYFPA